MQEKQQLTPFEWLDKVIDSMGGIKKTTAKMEEIKKALMDEDVEDSKITNIISFLEKPILNGKNSAFTSEVGVKPPATYDWRERGQIPQGRVEKIVEIGRANGLEISKHNLRPDKWDENDEPIKGGTTHQNDSAHAVAQ